MRTNVSSIVFALGVLFVSACGGGSSQPSSPGNDGAPSQEVGGDEGTPQSGSDNEEEPKSEVDDEPSPETGDEAGQDGSSPTPEVSVHFPWNSAVTSGDSITLRGSVSALPEGYEVRVNGQPLANRGNVQSQSKDGGSRASVRLSPIGTQAPGEYSSQSEDLFPHSDYEWSYEAVLVDVGVIEFSIVVFDAEGNPVTPEKTIRVEGRYVPTSFDMDPAMRSLVGMVRTDVVKYDLATKEQSRFTDVMDFLPISYCHKADTDDFIFISQGYAEDDLSENYYVFKRYPLSSDAEPSVFHTQKLPGEGIRELAFLCPRGTNKVYLVVNHEVFDEDGNPFSAVYSLNLGGSKDGRWQPLYVGDPWNEGGIPFDNAVMGDGEILVYAQRNGRLSDYDGIYQVDLESGAFSELFADYSETFPLLAQGSNKDKIYTATFDGIDILTPENGERRRVSDSEESIGHLGFSQTRSVALDEEKQRLLVGDSDQNMVIGVDLATGERTAVLSNGRGDGPRIIQPTDAIFDDARETAYVFDSGGNLAARIIRVKLETGDRQLLTTLGQSGMSFEGEMVRDVENGRLYAVKDNEIYRVSEETGKAEKIVSARSSADGNDENISGLALGREGDYLYYTSPLHPGYEEGAKQKSGKGAIFSVDLTNGNYTRSVVSQAGARGEGPDFFTVNSIVVDGTSNTAYVTDQYREQVIKVNLETGDRSHLALSCSGEGIGADETFQSIAFNSNQSSLFLVWDGVTEVEKNSGECLGHIRDATARIVIPGAGNTLFTIEQGGIYHLDPESLDKVIVSQ